MTLLNYVTRDMVLYRILDFFCLVNESLNEAKQGLIKDPTDSFSRDSVDVLQDINDSFTLLFASLTVDGKISMEYDEEEEKVFPHMQLKDDVSKDMLMSEALSFEIFLREQRRSPQNAPRRNSAGEIVEDRSMIFKLAEDALSWRSQVLCESD